MAEQADSKPPNFTIRVDKSLEWGDDPYQRSAPNKRYADYLGNEFHADMWFHVLRDNVRIPAHRLIIAAASRVLCTIAYGTGAIAGSIGDVPVEDCSADDFYEVLRYVYTGTINLTALNVGDILLRAHYYNLRSLEDECAASLSSTLTVQNILVIFDKIHLLDNKSSKAVCLRFIRDNTDELFADEQNLFDLNVDALRQVFDMNELRLGSDVDLFAELLKWGTNRCRAKDQMPTAKHLRHALNGRLDLIRFAAMTPDQFAKCVKMVDDRFFTDGEIRATFRRIAQCTTRDWEGNDPALGPRIGLTHYMHPRRMMLTETCMHQKLSTKISKTLTEIVFSITCEHNFCLHGFYGLPPKAPFTVERSDNSSSMISVGIKMNGRCVLFDKPLQTLANRCIHVKIQYAAEFKSYFNVNNITILAFS